MKDACLQQQQVLLPPQPQDWWFAAWGQHWSVDGGEGSGGSHGCLLELGVAYRGDRGERQGG